MTTQMTASHYRFPRLALIGAALVVAFSVAFAALSTWTGYGRVAMPEREPLVTVDLRFVDRADGGVGVFLAGTGEELAVIAPETGGFVRGVMRGLARERMLNSINSEPPFRLIRWASGTMSLDDPSTGRRVELDAFGPTNAGVFADLLVAAEEAR